MVLTTMAYPLSEPWKCNVNKSSEYLREHGLYHRSVLLQEIKEQRLARETGLVLLDALNRKDFYDRLRSPTTEHKQLQEVFKYYAAIARLYRNLVVADEEFKRSVGCCGKCFVNELANREKSGVGLHADKMAQNTCRVTRPSSSLTLDEASFPDFMSAGPTMMKLRPRTSTQGDAVIETAPSTPAAATPNRAEFFSRNSSYNGRCSEGGNSTPESPVCATTTSAAAPPFLPLTTLLAAADTPSMIAPTPTAVKLTDGLRREPYARPSIPASMNAPKPRAATVGETLMLMSNNLREVATEGVQTGTAAVVGFINAQLGRVSTAASASSSSACKRPSSACAPALKTTVVPGPKAFQAEPVQSSASQSVSGPTPPRPALPAQQALPSPLPGVLPGLSPTMGKTGSRAEQPSSAGEFKVYWEGQQVSSGTVMDKLAVGKLVGQGMPIEVYLLEKRKAKQLAGSALPEHSPSAAAGSNGSIAAIAAGWGAAVWSGWG